MQANNSPKQEKEELSHDETMATSNNGEKQKGTEGGDEWCPLFMEGLPKDFSTNPALAALASLLDEDESSKENSLSSSPSRPSAGGGKLKAKSRGRTRSRQQPYQKKPPRESRGSMGEAQLFLSMWKI
uniref:Uncharacterized protein n=1 Tax=Ditylum brightwellii TaxID=49249 RepID=A0A6V2EVE1_9STRA|mmetsp:Transcript_25503/g.33823  ORF Transcript_25503/g.33823 Transcript_25503/m.33823 type:complete len:128 (-) Transcript_25503:17-400(-)